MACIKGIETSLAPVRPAVAPVRAGMAASWLAFYSRLDDNHHHRRHQQRLSGRGLGAGGRGTRAALRT